jgi:hypothetical protein
MRAGYNVRAASRLAKQRDVDLHVAGQLLLAGQSASLIVAADFRTAILCAALDGRSGAVVFGS